MAGAQTTASNGWSSVVTTDKPGALVPRSDYQPVVCSSAVATTDVHHVNLNAASRSWPLARQLPKLVEYPLSFNALKIPEHLGAARQHEHDVTVIKED